MQPHLINLSVLFCASVIMCAAMALAWGSFGRPRHALSWAIGYGCSALQTGGTVVVRAIPSIEPFWWPFNDLLVILPAALLALGARQRIDRPERRETLALASAIVFAVILIGYLFEPFNPVRQTLATLFEGAMMVVTMRAIQPSNRPADAAERTLRWVLIAFSLYNLALALLIYRSTLLPQDDGAASLHELVYLIGLPPMFIALGIALLFLLAADLAARLRRLAGRDPLTGVHNRRGFREAAERTIAIARRQRIPVTIAVADIDHFKAVNDKYGHTAGDHALVHVSRTLGEGVRSGDLIGRIGGEEFALLLLDSGVAATGEVMERIRELIAIGFMDSGELVPITTSFGVAEIAADTGSLRDTLAEALDRADRALYQSKLNGRNRVTLDGGMGGTGTGGTGPEATA